MKLPVWLKARSFAFRTGLVLAALHFLFVSVNIIDMIYHPGEPWHMFWRLLAYLDFPVSLLIPWVIQPIYSALFSIHYLYLSERLLRFVTFTAFHLVVGSAWYFYLPILIDKACRKIAAGPAGKAIIVLLIILPVLSHWLQLLKILDGSTARFTPLTHSCIPVVWTALFIWLYFINSQKKRVLWLLFLVPFVFYYLANDLYFIIKYPN